MKPPFPGMDPFLEGHLWPDVHQEFASAIRAIISPKILPKYVARLILYTVDDTSPGQDLGIMYPDVEILKNKKVERKNELFNSSEDIAVLTPSTVTIPTVTSIEVRIPVIEILDREKNLLVTAIEILSPVNKRNPGLEPYRKKRENLYEAGVHLLEIDLLRRGTRPFAHPLVPQSHYLVTLIRAESNKTQIWGFNIQESLPVVPIPLKAPDPDVNLDLGKAMSHIFERGLYHLSIDYNQTPPPPDFSEEEQIWIKELIKPHFQD